MIKKTHKNQLNDVLSSLLLTISSFDSKASSLLTATGVIFAFSSFSIDNLLKISKYHGLNAAMYVFGGLYLCLFAATIIFLSLIIFPRKRKKNEIDGKIYSKYYLDIYKNMNNHQFLKEEADDDTIESQIRINSRIAYRKHLLLRISTVTIILMSIALVFFIFFSILVGLNPAESTIQH